MGLAPTASTTAALAMGDALAVALINRRHFKSSDFRRLHPGGNLGERLSLHVREVMLTGDRVPMVSKKTTLGEGIAIMNRNSLGALLVVGRGGRLEGIFTDGDLRRCVARGDDLRGLAVEKVMTRKPADHQRRKNGPPKPLSSCRPRDHGPAHRRWRRPPGGHDPPPRSAGQGQDAVQPRRTQL
jgi:hypothetical protein